MLTGKVVAAGHYCLGLRQQVHRGVRRSHGFRIAARPEDAAIATRHLDCDGAPLNPFAALG